MYSKLIAAASLLTLAAARVPVRRQASNIVQPPNNVATVNDFDGTNPVADTYVFYQGDGSSAAGWPAVSQWVAFDDMFNANVPLMQASCAQFGTTNDSEDEINSLRQAIEDLATASQLDHRFILAIVMQESNGCVRAPTTNFGVRNPGLMQDHDGAGTCNENGVQDPCPASEIEQMITDGVSGTPAGPGIAQLVNQAAGQFFGEVAQSHYQAARLYNSGSVDPSGDLGAGIATHCYSSDVANRLTGWTTAARLCTLDG